MTDERTHRQDVMCACFLHMLTSINETTDTVAIRDCVCVSGQLLQLQQCLKHSKLNKGLPTLFLYSDTCDVRILAALAH